MDGWMAGTREGYVDQHLGPGSPLAGQAFIYHRPNFPIGQKLEDKQSEAWPEETEVHVLTTGIGPRYYDILRILYLVLT